MLSLFTDEARVLTDGEMMAGKPRSRRVVLALGGFLLVHPSGGRASHIFSSGKSLPTRQGASDTDQPVAQVTAVGQGA